MYDFVVNKVCGCFVYGMNVININYKLCSFIRRIAKTPFIDRRTDNPTN